MVTDTNGPLRVLISVTGASTEPVVSGVALSGDAQAVTLNPSIARYSEPEGTGFSIRLDVPAASSCIVVRGEFEFADVNHVSVSIGNESSPASTHRKLAIAFAGASATFETFHAVAADAGTTSRSTGGIRGLRPATGSQGSMADLMGGTGPGAPAPASNRTLDPPAAVDYEVWFGTDRAPGEANDGGMTFTGQRGRALTVGRCTVRIPPSHRIGSTGSGLLRRIFGPDDRLKLIGTSVHAVDAWSAAIRARLTATGSSSRCGVVFVHGYNVSFRDAAIRAAQLGYDLSIDGPMAFYSWPSRGAAASYPADEATVDASEEYLLAFLQHFIGACAGAPVHVIAHSMGNRVLARTLVRLRSAQPGARIDQLIFAAPDIDQDTFASLALQFRDVAKQATLYVSARDSAVELSRVFHRAARAGLYPPVTILPGVDTVAVTNVDTSMLGHGYVAEARDVLHDMHSVLHFGMTPQQRMGLRLMATSGSQHWLIGS